MCHLFMCSGLLALETWLQLSCCDDIRTLQITPGEEGFWAVGSGYENSDPSGVPSNVQAAGRCAHLSKCHACAVIVAVRRLYYRRWRSLSAT